MSTAPTLLALVDVIDAEGHTRHSHPVHANPEGQARLRLGRALDNDLVLDDPCVAPHHAELALGPEPEGHLTLLPSLNGARQGRQHVDAPDCLQWPHDGLLHLGQTTLRLRHAAGALPLEQALARPTPMRQRRAWFELAALVLFVLGVAGFDSWLTQTPGNTWRPVGMAVLGMATGVTLWALLWSLVSQVFQRRFPFLQHLRWTLVALAALWVLDQGALGLAYAVSLPPVLAVAVGLDAVVMLGLLYVQGRSIWPRAAGRWLGLLLLGAALITAVTVWKREQQQHWFQPLYLSALPPPALRLAPLRSPDDWLQDAAALREELARKAQLDPVTGEPADAEE